MESVVIDFGVIGIQITKCVGGDQKFYLGINPNMRLNKIVVG